METNKIAEVLAFLKERHEFLERLQGDSTSKDMVKMEILTTERILATLGIKFELLSCYKCREPETAAKDEQSRYVCCECMMENVE